MKRDVMKLDVIRLQTRGSLTAPFAPIPESAWAGHPLAEGTVSTEWMKTTQQVQEKTIDRNPLKNVLIAICPSTNGSIPDF